jgi:D-inositol-3-phosphate glycosyltransferase
VRILHTASFYNASAGGFVPLLTALAPRLVARGDTFALAVPAVAGARWHDVARGAGIELHLVADGDEAVRFARAWRPDLMHVHFFGWEGRLTTALWRQRTRILWHVHSTVTSRPNGRAEFSPRSFAKYRLLGARVERLIAVSSALGDELAQQGAPRERIAIVRNAVDAHRFRPPSPAERAQARADLGLDRRPAILFFGRDARIKGADVLASALAELDRPTVIAVGTPDDARADLARFGEVVAVERVDDVVPLLWAADALAMPSRGEGFAFVLLEAGFCGLPIAASDLPALREAADDRAAVHFAAVGDAHALAGALRAALAGGPAPPREGPSRDDVGRWAAEILALYDRGRV